MRLIILKGLPGSGKSTLAIFLKGYLESKNLSVNLIDVDVFKGESTKLTFKEKVIEARDRTIAELKKNNADYAIIAELFYNADFVGNVEKVIDEHNLESFMFYIKRDLDELLKIESFRKRPIKNSKEDFKRMLEGYEDKPFRNEIEIENINVYVAFNQIISHLKIF